ncbi:UDP-2,3-diacylglucosamine diphosphatase [Algibacter lectus]|uniref:Ser/Thr protein phosphatase family protein n=1 Tax=Algibacter lectus TaxID=221126 RepID=A0A090WPC2_9FLAO|nr:UDP-2,3-diacylglucosamine diphosphatase [Algibacter lectus]MDO7138746.1 UDP-2,3-diacylglucosamine diphosphatase [Algibacter lectus]MWW25420.1 UDP-2,3-diacylglucosamine diphosphatase [Algibacter lectus]TDY61364.1 UDP-2,3-diacylglucosamine pyrophosphatase LpxH [Algibacter lectus]SFD07541.1 UDP-2,3-diacylglucosamine pyrophosphatase LpxH [Algibacter lectus]GAL63010.1 Ser/Thr protein phosphatase family protein UDP-2,3-diacylglucosamine hydrolase homolog [Algibacter lectus]
MKIKRKIEIAVISDVHLGTYGCHAKHLLTYLNSIEPKKLILNGDIIDIWQFSKRYFPKSHLKVIKKIMTMASNGVEVIYITGNHDEMLRKFSNTTIGNISIVDKIVLDLDGLKAWFFHGDVFDVSIQNAKWLAKLGGYGYDMLTLINRGVNWYLDKRGKERYSLSKKVKNGVKGAVKYINDYEKVISELAIENGYDYVVCGHIHQPKMEYIENKHGRTMYLNSGDWVENFTALEYQFKRWKIYNFSKDKLAPFIVDEDFEEMKINDLIAAITIVDRAEKKSKI